MIGDPSFRIEVETRVRARPETVFAFFTDAALYRRWKGQDAELDPRPGGLYRVQMPGPATVEGSFVVIEPPRRIVFTWGWVGSTEVPPGSTTVEVTFARDGDDTVVRLAHLGLPTGSSRDEHAAGWEHYLARLTVAAAGGDPGPDPMATASIIDRSPGAAAEVER
jgi:uncharacterized protein YndB with AHSA1/START domain